MFYFNEEKYDLWEVYCCLQKYFPIGINYDFPDFFHNYPGMRKYDQAIRENIYETGPVTILWNELMEKLKIKYDTQLIGTTTGITSCFNAKIVLSSNPQDNFTRTRELHFYVSLLGQFFTVAGMDMSEIRIEQWTFRSTNLLIVSPELEYKDSFISVSSFIEEIFKDYRFIPYSIYQQKINSLSLPYKEKNCTIFDALFCDCIDLQLINIFGDTWYKIDQWIKK